MQAAVIWGFSWARTALVLKPGRRAPVLVSLPFVAATHTLMLPDAAGGGREKTEESLHVDRQWHMHHGVTGAVAPVSSQPHHTEHLQQIGRAHV